MKKSVDAGARLICPEEQLSDLSVTTCHRSSSERRDSPAKDLLRPLSEKKIEEVMENQDWPKCRFCPQRFDPLLKDGKRKRNISAALRAHIQTAHKDEFKKLYPIIKRSTHAFIEARRTQDQFKQKHRGDSRNVMMPNPGIYQED